MTSFKLATCTVTLDGYADPAGTARRMTLLSDAASALSKNGIELFSLPGGYLFASSNADVYALQKQIENMAISTNIDLLVGIDTTMKVYHPDVELIRRGQLGALAVFAPKNGQVTRWRQRTSTRNNQHLVSDAVCKEVRFLRGTPQIEGLLCGEIFNKRIRVELAARETRIVIDQAHNASRFRIWAAMRALAQMGVSSLCSVHADRQGAIKHCYVPTQTGWEEKSSRSIDLKIGDKPRLEIKIWEFDRYGSIVA